MTYKNQILFGRIIKIHGFDGTVAVKIEQRFIENIPAMESVFIEIDGIPVPFFISMTEYSGGEIIKMRFTDYGSYDKISEFNGCRIFLTSYEEIPDNSDDVKIIEGFKVLKKNKEIIGTVKEIIENPGHDLLKIISLTGREILIPIHEDLITKIDNRGKAITVQLPDGLMEINE